MVCCSCTKANKEPEDKVNKPEKKQKKNKKQREVVEETVDNKKSKDVQSSAPQSKLSSPVKQQPPPRPHTPTALNRSELEAKRREFFEDLTREEVCTPGKHICFNKHSTSPNCYSQNGMTNAENHTRN